MKAGEFIDSKKLLTEGWIKLVKYGSMAHIYINDNVGIIVNSNDGQIIRIIDENEIKDIQEQWESVLSVVRFMK